MGIAIVYSTYVSSAARVVGQILKIQPEIPGQLEPTCMLCC